MSMNNIEFKAIPGQFNIDEAQGIVECFVAGIGNKDSVGDVLIPGAFTESLKRRKPRVVWGHNWNDPIGKVLEIYEVSPGDSRLPEKMKRAGIGGLYARVQFNLNSEKGKEAFTNVAFFGQEQEWSIGYKTLDAIHDPALQANILKEVELYEVSPVLHGANQLTGTISVKSDGTAEKCGPGMGMGHHMPMNPVARVVAVRNDDDDKPLFSEGLAQPISDSQRARLSQELQSRVNSPVVLISATENTAIFKRMKENGESVVYRIGYHTPDNYVTFMFGKPELADGQVSGSRVIIPSQMPSMPMQVKPQGNAYVSGESVEIPQTMNIGNIYPKQDSYEKSALDSELDDIENMLSDEFDIKVGRALNSRNLSKLKNIMQSLQEIIAASEKEIDTKSEMVIPVALEHAFQTKQLLDPIFDYHRVESEVTENGILITSPVSEEFVNAVDNAVKALGGTIGGGLGKGRRAARGLTARFDPNAWDGDGDGLVQEGTAFQRPAIPGVNDRSTRGHVNAAAATRAFRQEGGLASKNRQLDMTLDEFNEVEKTLNKYFDESQSVGIGADEDMQILDRLMNSISDSVLANDALPLSDKEIDEYMDTLTRMHKLGPVEDEKDKKVISDFVDALEQTKKSKTGTFESAELSKRGTRLSTSGNAPKRTMKPRKGLRSSTGIGGDYPDGFDSVDKLRKYVSATLAQAGKDGNHNEAVYNLNQAILKTASRIAGPVENLKTPEQIEDWRKKARSVTSEMEKLPGFEKGHWSKWASGQIDDIADHFSGKLGKKPKSRDNMYYGLASRGKPDPIKREGEFHGGNIYDEFNGQYVEGEVIALSDIYGDDTPGYGVVGRYDTDGTGTADYFYGGDDEEFETIEDAIAFLENIENEAENDRFYNDSNFRSLDRVRSAGRPGARPLSGLASASWQLPRAERDGAGFNVLDSQILKDRMSGSTLDELAEKLGIPREQVRQREAREMARLRLESDPRDIVAYRMMGLSLEDTGKLFGKTPEEIRKTELKEIKRFQGSLTDEDLLEYRERGLSLSDVAKMSGLKETEVRQREQRAIKNKPEIPEPDKPMSEDEIAKMQSQMRRDRGLASYNPADDEGGYGYDEATGPREPRSRRGMQDDPVGDAVVDSMDARDRAERAIRGEGMASRTEIVSGPGSKTPAMEKINDNVVLGFINPKHESILRDILSDVTPESMNGKNAGEVLSNTRKKLIEAIINGDFDDFKGAKISERNIKDYLVEQVGKIVQESVFDSINSSINKVQDRNRRQLLKNNRDELIDSWTSGLESSIKRVLDNKPPTDAEIASARKNAANSRSSLIDDLNDGTPYGGASDFWAGVEDILTDDPSIDSQELLKELQKASQAGLKKNPGDKDMQEIASALEADDNRFMSIVDEMENAKLLSDYYPDTVQSRRTTARGLASRSGTMLDRDGQIQRDERGNVDPTEARTARAEFDQAVFKKLRDLGFSDDDIETLTGVPNGGIVPEGAEPATYGIRQGGMSSRSMPNVSKMKDSELKDWANRNIADVEKRQARMADMKARGMSMNDIAKEFPTLSRSQISRDIASGDKKRTSGMASRGGDSFSLEMTGDEFATLADDLEFMGMDELAEKFKKAGKDKDSNQVSISPEELDKYMSEIQDWSDAQWAKPTTREQMAGNTAGDITDVLSRLKEATGRKLTSPNVEQDSGRTYRAGGGINPHEKLEFGLTEDEMGILLDEMDLFKRTEPDNEIISKNIEKMKAAKNGKFSLTAQEADELDRELGRITDENNFVGLDVASVLGQAADSKDGKLITEGASKRGLASAAKPGRKPNNGAPMDINENMQKELIFWAKRNQNLMLARKWTDKFDQNDGQLSSSDWRGLETLYNNLSPRGRRGMRSQDKDGPLSPINSGGPNMTPTGEGRELPTSRVRGLGEIGIREEASEGRPVGSRTEQDPRFKGKKFDEAKPSNWEEMDLEEKYEWLFSDGRPEKSGMRPVDYNKVLNELLAEEDRIERQKEKKNRRGGNAPDVQSVRKEGMSSRANGVASRAKEEDMPKKITDLLDEVVKKLDGYEKNKDKFNKKPSSSPSRESGMASRSMGMPSKAGRTMITDEATYFKSIEDSLTKEISKAREANDRKGADALSTLQQIIRRQEASKLGDRRTNVGSIYFTADEADSILDALMGVVDRQVARNDEKRIEIFAKLIDMMASAAMSTFVDKDTAEVNSRPRSGQVNL